MAKRNKVEIIINADDNASRKIGGIKKSLGGLKSALGGIAKVAGVALGAVGAAAVAAGAGILKLATDAAKIEPIERDFARLSESIGETTDAMIVGMREAAYGMVADADLMQSANRLISMGLAESAEEASGLTRMAVRLGEAMGKGPTEAMEEFALMMANQSIPRLDTFGISAGKVRNRITELMEANEALTREEAFAIAVREEGAKSLDRLGEGGVGAAASMARLRASFANIKNQVGKAFIPVLAALLEPLSDLATKYGPLVVEWAKSFAAWLERSAIPAVMTFGKQAFAWLGTNIPRAMASLSSFWESTLKPTLDALAEFWGSILGPAISAALPWLRDNVPKAMAAISGFWTGTLQPALLALKDYWASTLQPALATAATWLGENIPVAMAAISSFWAETLQPTVEEIITWLGENVPIAMEAISQFWNETLQPALSEAATWLGENVPIAMAAISQFWNETLRPAVEEIALWLGENIPLAMAAISTFWYETLSPALNDLWDFLLIYVKPVIEAISRVILELVRIAFEALWIIVTERIIPALKDVWKWIAEKLSPAVETVSGFVETFSGVLEPLQGFLEAVAEKANAFADALARIKPNQWFTPGSPTPFELGLRGIIDAAQEASKAVQGLDAPSLRMGGAASQGANSAGGQRIIVVAPVMVDSRQYQNTRGDYDYSAMGELILALEKGL